MNNSEIVTLTKNIAKDIVFILSVAVLFLSLCFILITIWIEQYYWMRLCIEHILCVLDEPFDGAPQEIYVSFIKRITIAFFFVFLYILGYIYMKKHNYGKGIIKRILLFIYPFESIYIPVGAALIISVLFFCWRTEMILFIARQINMASSNEIEKRYVRTRPEEYIFPEKKRNLIIIHLESIENLYQKPEVFGCNLIPELSKLQRDNISFYGNVQVLGSAWTQAFLTCLQYGMFRCFVYRPQDESSLNCLDSAYSLNEIFSKNGYTVSLIRGDFITFGGYDSVFRYVKNPRIIDRKVIEQNPDYWKFIKKNGNISSQRWSGWGVPDKLLYGIAKKELQTISKMNKPFFFMISLLDTHAPGYIYPDTPKYYHNIADAILETDRLVSKFVKWIQKQDFYSNTTVVLLCDHLAGNKLIRKFSRELGEREKPFSISDLKECRTAYNCFINLPFDLEKKQINRLFTSIDLAPSMLASVGVKNPDLGFGISLFSNRENFVERYGKNVFDKMYQTQFLYKKMMKKRNQVKQE